MCVRSQVLLPLGLVVAIFATEAAAEPRLTCGSFHTVTRGETLFKIAERAYGDGWLYEKIFEANRDLLPDEGSLEIGYELLIPCLDGSGPKTRREAMTSAAQDPANLSGQGEATERETTAHAVESAADKREGLTRLLGRTQEIAGRALLPHSAFGQPFTLETDSFGVEALQRRVADKAVQPERTQPMEASISAMADLTSEPPPAVQPLRLLTVSGVAPFAGQELPEGGMIPELVTRSIEAADATTRYLVSFESERSAHLRMQPHAFDLSFPWHKPDCGELQEMSEEGRILCTNFEFSRPFIEEAIGFYVRAGGSLVAAHEHTALEDRRICRPKAAPVIGIDQVDLGLAHSSIESPDMAFVCWAKLTQGEVDVVMVLKRQARQYLRQLGIANEVAEAEQLAVTRMLYGIVPRLNPRAEQVLDLINQGLDHVMLSGQWFNVVAFHNSRQTELLN